MYFRRAFRGYPGIGFVKYYRGRFEKRKVYDTNALWTVRRRHSVHYKLYRQKR